MDYRLTDAEIDRLIEDDLPYGDLTTRLLAIGDQPGCISFTARDPQTVSGIDEAARIFTRLGATVDFAIASGTAAPSGTLLFKAHGPAGALHAGWKVSQIVMEWAGGIATATARIVAAARSVAPAITVGVTRKSAPYTKKLALKAVLAGGGSVHRFGLSDSIMLFAEHRSFLDADISAAIATLRARAPEQSIAVEVSSIAEALAAQSADVIQLEKFTPQQLAQLKVQISKRPDGRPLIAPAGGINATNAAAYAQAGADILVTSAPYQSSPTDISVQISPVATKG